MAQQNPSIVNDLFAPRAGLLYAALFLGAGWHMPLFPVWLAACSLDPAAIGVVLAAGQLARILAISASTRLADRYASPNRAIAVACFAMAAATALIAFSGTFVTILIGVVLLGLVTAPVMPLLDAYTLKGLAARTKNYGPVRLWGSVAFIAGNLSGGLLLDALLPGNLIWLIVAANCTTALVSLVLVPVPREERDTAHAAGHSHLRDRTLLAIAAAGSLIQASHAVYYGFSTLAWSAQGFDGRTIGVLWALGVTAEILLFAYAARVTQIFGPIALILIGAAGGLLRWTLLMFDPPVAIMVPLQLLHALSFGATHLGTMMYLSQAAPEGRRVTMQGDVATANSVTMAAASALAGVLFGASGSLAYAAMAALCATGFVIALVARRSYPGGNE